MKTYKWFLMFCLMVFATYNIYAEDWVAKVDFNRAQSIYVDDFTHSLMKIDRNGNVSDMVLYRWILCYGPVAGGEPYLMKENISVGYMRFRHDPAHNPTYDKLYVIGCTGGPQGETNMYSLFECTVINNKCILLDQGEYYSGYYNMNSPIFPIQFNEDGSLIGWLTGLNGYRGSVLKVVNRNDGTIKSTGGVGINIHSFNLQGNYAYYVSGNDAFDSSLKRWNLTANSIKLVSPGNFNFVERFSDNKIYVGGNSLEGIAGCYQVVDAGELGTRVNPESSRGNSEKFCTLDNSMVFINGAYSTGIGYKAAVKKMYPTYEVITNIPVTTITQFKECGDELVVAGYENNRNTMVLFNPVTSNSTDLLNGEDIEVYSVDTRIEIDVLPEKSASNRKTIWVSGLDYANNQYILAKIDYENIGFNKGSSITKYPVGTKPQSVFQVEASTNDASGDYDGDGRTDLSVTLNGAWYIANVDSNIWAFGTQFGGPEMLPIRGDYNNDDMDEFAVYDAGKWYIMTANSTVIAWGLDWGAAGMTPVVGDYNGDGTDDLAVYGNGKWFVYSLAGNVIAWDMSWGYAGCIPVSGDYDGDGKADLAMYDAGKWYISSAAGTVIAYVSWGGAGFEPVSGDYDGDGKDDLATYKDGQWFIYSLNGNAIAYRVNWGGAGMIPVSGDYDGDGKDDLAVYKDGQWFIYSLAGNVIAWDMTFGGVGMNPVR